MPFVLWDAEYGRIMRRIRQPSWQVAIDEPDDLHLVLFVRDACRLTLAGPGPLVPQVPDFSGLLDEDARARAGDAWPAWWDGALDAHSSHSRALPPEAPMAVRHAQTRMAHAAMDGPQFAASFFARVATSRRTRLQRLRAVVVAADGGACTARSWELA